MRMRVDDASVNDLERASLQQFIQGGYNAAKKGTWAQKYRGVKVDGRGGKRKGFACMGHG
jgi:hypothetical protein